MLTAPARSSILACTAVAQLLGGIYVTFGGLVAFEMSALLGVGLLLFGPSAVVAAIFLLRHRLWAVRLSFVVVALWFLAGLGLALLDSIEQGSTPAWLGLAHAAPAALLLVGLWLSRPAGASTAGSAEAVLLCLLVAACTHGGDRRPSLDTSEHSPAETRQRANHHAEGSR